MITLSVCMIVKNEADTLARALDSIHTLADELIIVDTGSTDTTKAIAARYTDQIYDFVWVDNFAIARNFSFSKARMDYIMWFDADDVLLAEDARAFHHFKEHFNPAIDVVLMKYNLMDAATNRVRCSFYRERIVRRSHHFEWQSPVHEYIAYHGNFTKVAIAITHKKVHRPTRRNLEIYEKYLASGQTLSSRDTFYYAKELFNLGYLKEASVYYETFLTFSHELPSNYLDACMDLSTYYLSIGNAPKSLQTLLRYLELDGPRAELCCALGYHYKNLHCYDEAIAWFELAPHCPKPTSLGSVQFDYWDYVPYMELCACAYKQGAIDQAIHYNECAAQTAPNDPKICHNRSFLAVLKQHTLEAPSSKEG